MCQFCKIMKYKLLINWHGEVLTFYTHASDEEKALKNVIRQLAIKTKRNVDSIRKYIMDENKRRWEVVK